MVTTDIYIELTFIILSGRPSAEPLTDEHITKLPMVGDVNLFLKGTPPHLRATHAHVIPRNADEDDDEFEAELEIMIAGQSHNNFTSHALQPSPCRASVPSTRTSI